MDMFLIQGRKPLQGSVRISGSKNAALPMMAAALIAEGTTRLNRVPHLVDVDTLRQLLHALGAETTHNAQGQLNIQVRDSAAATAPYELVRRMRASICVLGPLLARRQEACVSLPGGCNIGHRPVDLHLKGLAALGAEIDVRNGYIHARAKRLRGARIHLSGPNGSTVTGTCNVLTAATLARGTTIIDGAACEPEVVALADFLNAMGAQITGQGTPRVCIQGVHSLSGVEADVIPDRIETATLMIAAAITRGSIQLTNTQPGDLGAVIDLLTAIGVSITQSAAGNSDDGICLNINGQGPLRPQDVNALPFPGIPTDTQAQLMALLATISGTSVVRDSVFPDRFMHVSELCRLGASIRQQGSMAVIHGGRPLGGASVMASDLRASAALVLAGLAAEGTTVIRRIYHLDRGYESLESKLNQLGAEVQRVSDSEPLSLQRLPQRKSA